MIDPEKAIKKLRKPPAVHNWVKNLRRRTDDTAQSLYQTAINGPRHSLRQVVDIIRGIIVDQIDDDTAWKCLARIGNARTKMYGAQILRAFLPYARERRLKGLQVFKDLQEFYPVGANVNVPVRPTFVLNEDGRLVPYFVICWAEIGLSPYQRRILTTVIQDAILSLEEFEGSDAVVLCIPRHSFSKTERYVVEWKLFEYPALDDDEKAELFERYGHALAEAERMILDNLA